MPYIFSPELVESVNTRESINIRPTHSDRNYLRKDCSAVHLLSMNTKFYTKRIRCGFKKKYIQKQL